VADDRDGDLGARGEPALDLAIRPAASWVKACTKVDDGTHQFSVVEKLAELPDVPELEERHAS
jgi:hypothetical protein